MAATLLWILVIWLKLLQLWFPYLLPGVEDHDIISGEVILGQLPGYLLDLRGGKGLSGAVEEELCAQTALEHSETHLHLHFNQQQQRKLQPKTYDEVSSLIGAGKESGWMSVHLVLKSGRRAVFCLSSQSLPELICKDHRCTSSYYSFMYYNRK